MANPSVLRCLVVAATDTADDEAIKPPPRCGVTRIVRSVSRVTEKRSRTARDSIALARSSGTHYPNQNWALQCSYFWKRSSLSVAFCLSVVFYTTLPHTLGRHNCVHSHEYTAHWLTTVTVATAGRRGFGTRYTAAA